MHGDVRGDVHGDVRGDDVLADVATVSSRHVEYGESDGSGSLSLDSGRQLSTTRPMRGGGGGSDGLILDGGRQLSATQPVSGGSGGFSLDSGRQLSATPPMRCGSGGGGGGGGGARVSGITGLDLRGNALDAPAVAQLTACLLEVATVVDLDLSDNQKLGSKGAEAVCALLPPSSTSEVEGCAALRTLLLNNSGCGARGAVALGAALALNSSLSRLELSDCHLGDAGAVALGAVFAENVCLKLCVLRGNSIGVPGARAIAAGLNPKP